MYNPTKRVKSRKAGGAGIVPRNARLSAYEAKQEALYLLRTNRLNPGTLLSNVVDLCATTGVWGEKELMALTTASVRTLQRYRKKGYLDLAITPDSLATLLGQEKLKIYCLGPIGLALAELRHGLVPTGYLNQKMDRVSHDYLTNLVAFYLYQAARPLDYSTTFKSKYESTLHDRKGMPLLEPDLYLTFMHDTAGEKKHHFLMEYHHEDFGSRAAEKVAKYEQIYAQASWRSQWHVESFPPILIVTTHRAVAHGYKKEIEERGVVVKCRYLIKSIRSFLEASQPPLKWLDLAMNRTVNLLDL